MPSLKAIKTRIGSVKNTQKITRAMKLVAAAKMKRAVDAAVRSRPYSNEVTAVLRSLMARLGDAEHPLLQPHEKVKTATLVVLTSDRGLCGGFNSQLLRKVDGWLFDNVNIDERYESVELIIYGKKARDYFRHRKYNVVRDESGLEPSDFFASAQSLGRDLMKRYEEEEIDRAYLAYNTFFSALTQQPTISQLFPIGGELEEVTAQAEELEQDDRLATYEFEPTEQQIFDVLIPQHIDTHIYQAFLESEAGEHGSRMTAMDSATRNAGEMIDRLTLQYNRARQAAITKELVEIVSGAEAL